MQRQYKEDPKELLEHAIRLYSYGFWEVAHSILDDVADAVIKTEDISNYGSRDNPTDTECDSGHDYCFP